jgi:hypothetical protein
MRFFDRQGALDFLRTQGVSGESDLERILGGFDFDRPVYEQSFWQGDFLYQLIRMPSASLPSPNVGNWFGIAGMTTHGVAINDGVSGRRAVQFEVVSPFTALEGSARPLPVDVFSAIGGAGGGTQVFVPTKLLGRLQSVGAVDRW